MKVKLLDCPSTRQDVRCSVTIQNHDDQWYYIDPAAVVVGYGSKNGENIYMEHSGFFRNKADSSFFSVAKFTLMQDSLYFLYADYQPFYGDEIKHGMKRIDFHLYADTVQFRACAPLPEDQQRKLVTISLDKSKP